MKQVIHGYVRPESSGYLAHCLDLPVSTRAGSLDEAVEKLHRQIRTYLEGKNLSALGLGPQPKILVTFHFGPVNFLDF